MSNIKEGRGNAGAYTQAASRLGITHFAFVPPTTPSTPNVVLEDFCTVDLFFDIFGDTDVIKSSFRIGVIGYCGLS